MAFLTTPSMARVAWISIFIWNQINLLIKNILMSNIKAFGSEVRSEWLGMQPEIFQGRRGFLE